MIYQDESNVLSDDEQSEEEPKDACIYSKQRRTMSSQFFTYMARCNDNSLYTGITNNIKEREERHNKGIGSKYTRIRLPLKIIYFETYATRKEAAQREIQLKGWTKQKKENLIKKIHPTKNNKLH